jgi:pimeloyl-ACP methyl ester carboxylesterase
VSSRAGVGPEISGSIADAISLARAGFGILSSRQPVAAFLARESGRECPAPNTLIQLLTGIAPDHRHNPAMGQHTVLTSHGRIVAEDSGANGLPLLLIHGNSFCRGVFRHQLYGELAQRHRLIAFDLPGHGESDNALDPAWTYTLTGFADAAIEVLGRMGVTEVVVLGWSLSGHIGIEMMSRLPECEA